MSQELYELALQGNHNGQFVETILHVQGDNLTANETLTNGEDLLDGFDGNITGLWCGCMPASYTLERLAARRINPVGSATAHLQYTRTAHPGTLGTVAAAYQLCPTLFLIPTIGTKTGGKIFIPAIASTMVGSNTYSSTFLTAIDTLMAALTANFGNNTPTWQLAVYSRKLTTWSAVVSWQMSTRFGFQKRRRYPIGA